MKPTILIPLVALLASAGCLSKPPLKKESFALQTPAMVGPAGKAGRPSVSIRGISVASLYSGRELTYRTGENSYERDPYAGFLVPADRMLLEPVRGYLHNARLFSQVLEPGSPVPADYVVEVTVTELYGDFRNRSKPEAVVGLRVIAYKASDGAVEWALLQKDYRQSVLIPERTAAAVVAGYDEAMRVVMGEVIADLERAGR